MAATDYESQVLPEEFDETTRRLGRTGPTARSSNGRPVSGMSQEAQRGHGMILNL